MQLREKVLVHQVHRAKVAADVTASVVSGVLLWHGRPKVALAVRVLVPVAGSGAVLALADLDALARTRRGQYVLAHMPPSAQAVRLAGDALMGIGAHRRSRVLLVMGAALIAGGWSLGLAPVTACRGRAPVTGVAGEQRVEAQGS